MYTHLLFDLDNTLLDFSGAESFAIRRTLSRYGLPNDDAMVALYSGINQSFWERFERNEIERDEIFEGRFKALAARLGLKLDTAAISRTYFAELSERGDLLPGATALLESLAPRYTLAAVTNGALHTQTRRIAVAGIEKYFNGGIYISEALGLQKPQPAYFAQVLSALGNPQKQQVLMLGDSLSGDIAGGIGAGLDTCYVSLSGRTDTGALHPTFTVHRLCDIPTVCGL